jgi:hypothetical protein
VSEQNFLIEKIYGNRTPAQKRWIDVASAGEPTALVYTPRLDVSNRARIKPIERASNWWDLIFWNSSIATVYVPPLRDPPALAPFPGPALAIGPEWATGVTKRAVSDRSHFLTLAASNPFFAPQYLGAPVARVGYVTYDTGEQTQAAWATRGLTRLGWVPPTGATLRVYAPRDAVKAEAVAVNLLMATTRRPPVLKGFKVEGTASVKQTRQGRKTLYRWSAKIPPGDHADFKLVRGDGNAHVESIAVSRRPRG